MQSSSRSFAQRTVGEMLEQARPARCRPCLIERELRRCIGETK